MGEASRQNKQLRSLPQIHTAYETLKDSYVRDKRGPQQPPDIQEDSRFRIDVYAKSTADSAIFRKIGSAFFMPGLWSRCRSPPASEITTQLISETEEKKVSSSRSHGSGGNSRRDKRDYRRIYDENRNILAHITTVYDVDVNVTEKVFCAHSHVGAVVPPDISETYVQLEEIKEHRKSLEKLHSILVTFSHDDCTIAHNKEIYCSICRGFLYEVHNIEVLVVYKTLNFQISQKIFLNRKWAFRFTCYTPEHGATARSECA